jgi:hypothetical protein
MGIILIIVGLVLLGLGIAGFLFVNRRSFYRRNAAGIQEFKGYGNMLTTRVFETILRIGSFLLVLLGLGAIINSFGYFNR